MFKKEYKNIIINFPTNIGDTILTFPAVDRIIKSYPLSKITAIGSSRTINLLLAYKGIDNVILFNKYWRIKEKINFVKELRGKYDLVVDFKNSFLPVLLGGKRTPFLRNYPLMHKKDFYLHLVRKLISSSENGVSEISLSLERKNFFDNLLNNKAIFIATCSRSHNKAYPASLLYEVINRLGSACSYVLLGEEKDRRNYEGLNLKGIINLCGKTDICDLFYIIKRYALFVLSVDSAILHIASYLNVPVLALFGPTDSQLYGPWSKSSVVLKKESGKIQEITPDEIVSQVRKFFSSLSG